jgi:hypothetical protein
LGKNRVSPDELDIEKFADALSDDYILIYKHHQTAKNLPKIPEKYRDKFAYDMTKGRGLDINELMTVSDICITDYSSVAFEFSLFERPLLFFVFDLEEYIDDRGLYYDFNEVTPGPLCKTTEDMIDYIKNIDERFNKQEVIDFKNKFMCSCDGHSTERILDYLQVSKKKSPSKLYKVYYFGKGAKKENYSTKLKNGKIHGEVQTTPSGNFEFRDSTVYSFQKPCTILKNDFVKKNHTLIGWHMRRTVNGTQYWYCKDKTWKKGNHLTSKKYLFKEGDVLDNISGLNDKSILVLEAQWAEKKFLKKILNLFHKK